MFCCHSNFGIVRDEIAETTLHFTRGACFPRIQNQKYCYHFHVVFQSLVKRNWKCVLIVLLCMVVVVLLTILTISTEG